eukprot:CAMPEP_0180356912 /NCGR_PEP_ID=MMETSP0989-20121125/9612_1 /TAXON_ID=697907 /ORGANISM="non described non described, Strain CCMP2293" /LENGTH=591 /DNA_ID=CAMNT_0022347047 /DNA_START=36 /DNA_END=1808 /DNA_ORIENTATION=+
MKNDGAHCQPEGAPEHRNLSQDTSLALPIKKIFVDVAKTEEDVRVIAHPHRPGPDPRRQETIVREAHAGPTSVVLHPRPTEAAAGTAGASSEGRERARLAQLGAAASTGLAESGLFSGDRGLGEKIDTLLRYVRGGRVDAETSELRNVFVVGCTGSGKSTLVNALAGCELVQLSRPEAAERSARLDALRVRSPSEGGRRSEVARIGHHMDKSETIVLHPTRLEGEGLVVWDAPGLEDTSGPEVNIATAVNLCKLLRGSGANGLVFVVLLDTDSVAAARGSLVQDTLEHLGKLFADENTLKKALPSVIFCLSKFDEGKFALDTVKDVVIGAVQKLLSCAASAGQICMFDPLGRNEEATSVSDILRTLRGLPPLTGAQLFKTSLNRADVEFLRDVCALTSAEVERCMEAGKFGDVQRLCEVFESLTIIAHPTVDDALRAAVNAVQRWVNAWSGAIHAAGYLDGSIETICGDARAEVVKNLDLISGARVLQALLPEAFSIEAVHQECVEFVKGREARFQSLKARSISSDFITLLDRAKEAVKLHVGTRPREAVFPALKAAAAAPLKRLRCRNADLAAVDALQAFCEGACVVRGA